MPVIHNRDNGGTVWAKDDREAKYLLLFQNLDFSTNFLPEKAKKKFPKVIPYGYSYPSTKDILGRWECKKCNLYLKA